MFLKNDDLEVWGITSLCLFLRWKNVLDWAILSFVSFVSLVDFHLDFVFEYILGRVISAYLQSNFVTRNWLKIRLFDDISEVLFWNWFHKLLQYWWFMIRFFINVQSFITWLFIWLVNFFCYLVSLLIKIDVKKVGCF